MNTQNSPCAMLHFQPNPWVTLKSAKETEVDQDAMNSFFSLKFQSAFKKAELIRGSGSRCSGIVTVDEATKHYYLQNEPILVCIRLFSDPPSLSFFRNTEGN